MACRGLFLDKIAVERVITDRRQARADALMGELPTVMTPSDPKQKLYIKCPVCKAVMNRKLFAAGSGVIVDVCRAHGTFFDIGELPRVIEYVQQGGLEKAEKKEIARMHEQAKSEQRKAAAAAASGARVSGNSDAGTAISTGGALVDLLTSLFG
jgi:Zn-finger nucleic acid-binding protein